MISQRDRDERPSTGEATSWKRDEVGCSWNPSEAAGRPHLQTNTPTGPTAWTGTRTYTAVAVVVVTLFASAVLRVEPFDMVSPLAAATIGLASFAVVATWSRWGP